MANVWRFHELGGPEVLQLESVSLPSVGIDDVHISVKAIGLNRSDINFRKGQYIQKAQFPSRFGYEASGIVVSIGANVTHLSPGDEVFVLPVDDLSQEGTSADELVINHKYVVHKPSNLSFVEASAVWMQYLTAWGGIIHAAEIKKGDYVLITAATSSVGIAAIQLARQVGAIPIATCLGTQWRQLLKNVGAEHVIPTNEVDLLEELNRITGEEGLAAAFDAVGGPQVLQIAEALKKFGRLVIHGYLSSEPTPFPHRLAIRKTLTVQGYLFSEILDSDVLRERAKSHILQGLATGVLVPNIDKVFAFEDMREAQTHLEQQKHFGKVVLSLM